MKQVPFLQKTFTVKAIAGVALLGGLLAAYASIDSAHIRLKLADPNEGPARITMAPAAQTAMPSVVKISASKLVQVSRGPSAESDDPFRQFFGGNGGFQPPRPHREGGLGSGVVISPDGYILTNNHVIDGATDVRVTLPDRREFKAQVVGADSKTDIAVLKIAAGDLPAITVGNSSKLQVGDSVLAIGNPFGVGQTVTMGIVSAKGRANLGIEDYEDFVQTDAAINPGNSGGALVNDRGELVGINTAILSGGSGGNQGIGFAVPVNLARQVMDQIVLHGKVMRAYIGVTVQEVTPAIAKAIGLGNPKGALVSDVMPNSPAQKAGLESGDVILAMNGTSIQESNQLRMNISMMGANQPLKLQVFRDGKTVELTAATAEMPDKRAERVGRDNGEAHAALEGISVETLNPRIARQAGVDPATKGVVVTGVDPASAAATSGLQEGDVIEEVNRRKVTNPADFAAAMEKAKSDPLLLINRHGNRLYIAG